MSKRPRKTTRSASAYRRATRTESETLGVTYTSKHYVPKSVSRVTRNTPKITERKFRTLREGVTVEQTIREHKEGSRAYASPAAHVRAQRAITRNARNPIRALVREKKASGHRRMTERAFEEAHKAFLAAIQKKSGVRWYLNDGKWKHEETGAKPQELTPEEFERFAAHYRANENFYKPLEEDVFFNKAVPSPRVAFKNYQRSERARADRQRRDRERRERRRAA